MVGKAQGFDGACEIYHGEPVKEQEYKPARGGGFGDLSSLALRALHVCDLIASVMAHANYKTSLFASVMLIGKGDIIASADLTWRGL
jgi:hypothetical protein